VVVVDSVGSSGPLRFRLVIPASPATVVGASLGPSIISSAPAFPFSFPICWATLKTSVILGLPTSSSMMSLAGDENNRGSFNVGAGIPDEKPVVVVVVEVVGFTAVPPLERETVEGDKKVFIFVGWRGSGLTGVVIGRT
jgi:hypothetical protein